MNKIILNIFSLILTINTAVAKNTDSLYYCKIVKGEANSLHLLMNESKPVTHLFDALPKLSSYRSKDGLLQLGSAKEEFRVFYPTHVNSGQRSQLEIYIPTEYTSTLHVTLSDLHVADTIGLQDYKKITKESEEMFKQLKIPPQKLPAFVPSSQSSLDAHNLLYNNALRINSDYIPSEKACMIPATFKGFDSSFITINENYAFFSGLIDKQFILQIQLEKYKQRNCKEFESYIQEYISKFNFIALKAAVKK